MIDRLDSYALLAHRMNADLTDYLNEIDGILSNEEIMAWLANYLGRIKGVNFHLTERDNTFLIRYDKHFLIAMRVTQPAAPDYLTITRDTTYGFRPPDELSS